jgi:hypothetical protein
MKCAVHTDVDAAGYCRNCGKALCPPCARDVRGILYCETCLADILTKPAGPAAPTGSGSPGLAAVLGFVPGLGAVYNGQYLKALVHVIIFAAFVGFLNGNHGDGADAVAGIGLSAFIVYMAIDAFRTAKAKQLGEKLPGGLGEFSTDKPVGPILLIVLGVLFLLDKMGVFSVDRLFDYWPVFLIAVGVLLLWKRMAGSPSGT